MSWRSGALGARPDADGGVSRAALALVIAVIAAAAVLAGGALRSGANPSPGPSGSQSQPVSSSLASLPAPPTSAPTLEVSPPPPEPTGVAHLRGQFVGGLGHVETCPILYERDGVLELVLPDGYRSQMRGGSVQILDPNGGLVADEGDLIGVNGRMGGGISSCLAGPRLHVTRFVDVRHRDGE